jgi:hypothetical protein
MPGLLLNQNLTFSTSGAAGDRPGLAVLVAYHDRKASADDLIDSVSGTHGLAGAADTVAVMRRRQSDAGTLKIVGRAGRAGACPHPHRGEGPAARRGHDAICEP